MNFINIIFCFDLVGVIPQGLIFYLLSIWWLIILNTHHEVPTIPPSFEKSSYDIFKPTIILIKSIIAENKP